MVDITNASRAMRGINTEDQGTVWLQPGETREGLNVAEGERKVLERVAKEYGLVFGTAQEAREQLRAQAEEGDGDLVDLEGNAIGGGLLGSDGGGSGNYEDSSTTDIPTSATTLHPLPADMDVGEPEPRLDTLTVAQPWANPQPSQDSNPEEAGQGSTNGGEDGGNTTRRSKAKG